MTDTAVSRDPAEIGTDDPALEKIVVDPQEVAEVKRGRRFVPGPGWRSGVPRYAAIVLFFVAGFSILSALVPFFRRTGSVTRWVSEIVAVPAVPYLTWGVLLWIVAAGLYRRKRVAFRVAFALKALLALVFALFIALYTAEDQLDGIDVSGADLWEAWAVLIGSLIVLVILWLARREFFALVPKGNGRKAFLAFIAGAALTVTVGWLLTAFVPGTLPRESRLTFALGELFSPLGVNVGEQLGGEPPRPIILITGLLGALTLIVAAHFLFRPEKSKVMLTAQDEVGIRGLLRAHGEQDSLGYFATRRDKSAIFSSSGKAAVTYRVLNGVSLASGDPIGDREAWPAAIEAWLEECRRFAWAPAVMGASRYGATAYARSGLQAFHLGDEAILNFHEFNLDGRDSRVVRQAVSRVERAGYTSRVRRHSDIPEAEMLAAVQFCDQTRDTPDERGFSMALGRMNDPADGRCVMVEAFDADGVLQGVLSFSPWGDRGVSLDLMRRARSAENGVVEFMVAALVDAGPRLGIDRASLNFAVLRAVFAEGEEIGAGPVLRFSRATLMFASRWYQLESLYRSNAKYNPEWVPRYLMYETARDLPRVAVASAIAEGFLPEPRLPGISPARPKSPLLAAATGAPMALIAADEAAHAQAEVDDSHRTEDTRLPEQERVRRDKLDELVAAGEDPFFASFQPDTDIASIRAEFADLPAGETTGRHVAIAGRVMRNRITGKLIFAELRDFSGDLQVMLSLRQVGQERLDAWKHAVDLGDLVGVRGEVISSKRGELSVLVDDWVMTAKCLVPLPDKHKGLTDPEARVRQRYVDLIVNDDSRDMLALRARVVRSVRESLWRRGFLEVETPMLQPIHGGANARPFITHINAYDMRLYLRIATELYLKRLLVGGAPKVFEVNRNFRNEGADATHNPEFTALEVYDAYGDYDTMRELTREIILEAAIAAWGRPIIRRPTSDGGFEEVDISGEWAVVTLHEGISRALGTEVTSATELSRLQQLCRDHGIPYESEWDADQVTLEMYERLCEEHTTMPTFYKDFPTGVSPLTRQKPSDPRVAERWDLVAFGAELATAYTELTDPIEQRARLTAQSLLAASGDPEAMELDEDFLRALEYGMPPTGGQGMGIDRLVMFLTGASIRETLLFPIVRPDK